MTAVEQTKIEAAAPQEGTPATTAIPGVEAPKAPEQQATEATKDGARVPDPAQPEAEKAKDAPKAGAPDKYDFKAPQGHQFDPKVIEAYAGVAKELGMPQEAAQRVLDQIVPVMQQRESAKLDAMRADWQKAIREDKEFGGDRLKATTEEAAKAVATFGDDDMRELLKLPIGDHPAVVRFMAKVGRSVGGDRMVGGKPPVGDRQQALIQALYAKSGMK